jgi:hypothetical protein
LFVNLIVDGTRNAGIAEAADATDNNEANQFVGGAVFNNVKYAITGCPDCFFEGTSFDYNWSDGTVGGPPDITGAVIHCSQCHFEKKGGAFSDSGMIAVDSAFSLGAGSGTEPYLVAARGDQELALLLCNVFSQHPVKALAAFDGSKGTTGQLVLDGIDGNGNGAIAASYAFGAQPPAVYRIVDGMPHTSTKAISSQPFAALEASAYHETLRTPASSSAPCRAGDFADDANYHYVCVADSTWKRVALSSF